VSGDWRPATSLLALFAEVNALAPHRSKASDGLIGDENHDPSSDHCPDAGGVVRGADVTHDPAGGLDCNQLAQTIRQREDPRVKYIIFHRKIMSGTGQTHTAWKWRHYTGDNPHETHMHVSIKGTADADSDVRSWLGGTPLLASAVPVKGWDEMATKEEIKAAVREVLREELGIVLRGDAGTTDGGTHPHNLQNINKTLRIIIEGDPGTTDGGTHPHNLRNINRTVKRIDENVQG
jgi:hypothetical protein